MLAMFAGVLLVLAGISANVATLMFARTALREQEIALRTALGATRGRIIAQLLAESLVLSGTATLAGLLLARGLLQFIRYEQVVVGQEPAPFWRSASLAPATVLWAIALACVGAVLVGLLPALKATGAKVGNALMRSTGSASGMRFGGVWSFVIVAQVAFSVLCLPIAIGTTREALRDSRIRPAFSARDYVTFEAQFDEASGPRLDAAYAELDRRLLAEPSVAAVTHATAVPGAGHLAARRMEARRGTEAPSIVEGQADGMILSSQVDLDFFTVFPLPLVVGRGFSATDLGAQTVVVNAALAQRLGGNPVGMQLRDVAPRGEGGVEGTPGPWLDVVGVVGNSGMEGVADVMYQAARPSGLNPGSVAVRLRGNPGDLAGRIPRIALDVDPELRVYRAQRLDEVVRQRALPGRMAYIGVLGVIALAIALSAAGLFALMAVSVQRRTREIGIRLALGASSRGVLRALFARAAAQLGGGILLGNLLVFSVRMFAAGTAGLSSLLLPMLAISTLMTLVGVAACAVPARRALRVQPTEAIKDAG